MFGEWKGGLYNLTQHRESMFPNETETGIMWGGTDLKVLGSDFQYATSCTPISVSFGQNRELVLHY